MILYIDPGTGSMLFTVLIGIIGAAVYSFRMLFIKLRYKLGGKKVTNDKGVIPFVIFSDDKRYYKVFEPICREMDARGKDIVYLTMSEDDPVFSCPYCHVKAEFIGKDHKAFARLNFLSATVVLSTTPGLDVYQWKRSKGVSCYVHIPHAASEITLYRMFGIDYYDALLLSGRYQQNDVRTLESMRSLPEKEIALVGIPYMDEMLKRYEKEGGKTVVERTVLLAPSWGKSAIFSLYGGKIIDTLLDTGYKVIIRPHPQSFVSEREMIDSLMEKYPSSDRVEWNRDNDNFDVLNRSDILISDFSGVIFDFALIYDRPIIYTKPELDLGQYDAWWMSDPLWTLSALPRLGMELNESNMSSLKELIDSCIEDPKYSLGRKEVTEETWVFRGEGAKRAADYLVNKYFELTAKQEEK